MAVDLSQVDLTDLDTFAHGFPHDVFRAYREQAPVWWHAPTRHTPDGEGFWSVATYDDVLAVLRDPVRFSSETGGEPALRGDDHSGPPHSRRRPQHDGRPAARGYPTPRHQGPDPGGRAGPHARAAPPDARSPRGGGRRVRLPRRRRSRASDAGHLPPARRTRGGPALPLRGGRAHLRPPRRVRPLDDDTPAPGCTRPDERATESH